MSFFFLVRSETQDEGAVPNTPIIIIRSPISAAVPEFDVRGEFAIGDTIWFERQERNGDWSSAEVVTYVLQSGDLSGTPIELGLDPLPEGEYEYRIRNKRAGGDTYSAFSPIESSSIDFTLRFAFVATIPWTGSGGSATRTANGFGIGAPFTNRRLYIFGQLADPGSGNTVDNLKVNGVNATLTQFGDGGNLHWMATALVEDGVSVDLELNYAAGVFNAGRSYAYIVDETLLSSISPLDVDHILVDTDDEGTLSITTENQGITIVLGNLFGGTATSLSITSSDDTFIEDDSAFASMVARAEENEARTANITLSWSDVASDGYLTAWSFI